VLHAAEGRALYVTVLPYHSSWAVMEGHPSAILFLTTPEEQGQGEHRLWQGIFGMSPAECRVAEMMKQGWRLAKFPTYSGLRLIPFGIIKSAFIARPVFGGRAR